MRLLFVFVFLILSNSSISYYKNIDNNKNLHNLIKDKTATKTQRLFFIERNMDKNIVVYDANILANGKINVENPVDVYWVQLAKDGSRSELNFIERKIAYGYNFEPSALGSVYVTIKAFTKRKILLLPDSKGNVKPIIKISNIDAHLTRIYVNAKPKLYTTVNYIELFGTDVRNGKPVYEKILNN